MNNINYYLNIHLTSKLLFWSYNYLKLSLPTDKWLICVLTVSACAEIYNIGPNVGPLTIYSERKSRGGDIRVSVFALMAKVSTDGSVMLCWTTVVSTLLLFLLHCCGSIPTQRHKLIMRPEHFEIAAFNARGARLP